MAEKLFKAQGVFWEQRTNRFGDDFLADSPFCSNDTCRTLLDQVNLGTDNTGAYMRGWSCCNCGKTYPCEGNDYHASLDKVRKIFEGYKRLGHTIYSLDLPPTKVVDEAEDENYWVQARISEKNGKRMAVIYFGEKIRGVQAKTDYAQVFLDFEDEQMRFDKTNKSPVKVLARLTGEFPGSSITLESKG